VLTLLQQFATDGLSVADSFRELSKGMARWLRDSAYREGTLLATTSVGAVPDMPKLHAAIRKAFDEWRGHVVQRLSRDGFTQSASKALANTMIAGLEGAMILARIHQDEHIVVTTAETLARLVESSPRYSAGGRRRTPGPG
jgi:TetR/AcrR family transcriptional repressor of lmrAB and yxaGH operons